MSGFFDEKEGTTILERVAFLLRLSIYNFVHTDCLRSSVGASISLKSSFPQRKIDLDTEL